MSDVVQQVKDRLSIVEVVAPYVQLQQAGKNLKGKSPFTNERTPSFYVSPERGMFYCFSTNQGGDIFTFTQLMEGVDFKGALKQLAERANVQLVAENPERRTERDALYALLEAAASFYAEQLQGSTAPSEYLKLRGVKDETVARWRIGYAPGPPLSGWRALSEAMQAKGYTIEQLRRAGLVKGGEAGKAPYDVFRDRIMFPLFDASGRVVAFSGRLLSKDSEAPKYVNSPETELYNKSELLYGYDRAKEGIRKLGFSMIVEGQFDVVMSHQAGYHNTVAVSGTALTPHHIDLLQRLSQKVVLALDSDRAGIAAIMKAAHLMLGRGMDTKVIRLPEGADPADVIREDATAFKRAVGEAVHVIPFLLSQLQQSTPDQRSLTLKVREVVIPFVVRIPSAIEREFFIGVVADAIASTKEAVRIEVERLEKEAVVPVSSPLSAPVPESIVKTVSGDRVSELSAFLAVALELVEEKLRDEVNAFTDTHLPVALTEVRSKLTPERQSELTFTLENSLGNAALRTQRELLADKVNLLVELVYTSQIAELRETLKIAEYERDEARVLELLSRISELQKLKTKARFEPILPAK